MKKLAIVCAIVLAAGLSSCGDTNYCYEITTKVSVLGIENTTTSYYWGTSNDLKTYEQTLKDAQTKAGISEDAITISHTRTTKSQSDCSK